MYRSIGMGISPSFAALSLPAKMRVFSRHTQNSSEALWVLTKMIQRGGKPALHGANRNSYFVSGRYADLEFLSPEEQMIVKELLFKVNEQKYELNLSAGAETLLHNIVANFKASSQMGVKTNTARDIISDVVDQHCGDKETRSILKKRVTYALITDTKKKSMKVLNRNGTLAPGFKPLKQVPRGLLKIFVWGMGKRPANILTGCNNKAANDGMMIPSFDG